MKPQKWVVLSDIHLPYHDEKTLNAVEKFIADNKWDGWICLGDLLDFNEISRWVVGKPRQKKLKIKEYFEAGNDFLKRHRKLVGPKCQMVLLEGNHEWRIEDWLDSYPEFEGLLEVEKLLGLKEKRIQWVKSWSAGELFKKGHAVFYHGRYTNKYHAAKNSDVFGTNVYYGHCHDVQEISKEMIGNDKTIVGKSLGCLCDYDQKYLKGAPTKWQQAFAVFHFFPDDFFTEQTIRIFKHRFVAPNGKIYQG